MCASLDRFVGGSPTLGPARSRAAVFHASHRACSTPFPQRMPSPRPFLWCGGRPRRAPPRPTAPRPTTPTPCSFASCLGSPAALLACVSGLLHISPSFVPPSFSLSTGCWLAHSAERPLAMLPCPFPNPFIQINGPASWPSANLSQGPFLLRLLQAGVVVCVEVPGRPCPCDSYRLLFVPAARGSTSHKRVGSARPSAACSSRAPLLLLLLPPACRVHGLALLLGCLLGGGLAHEGGALPGNGVGWGGVSQ